MNRSRYRLYVLLISVLVAVIYAYDFFFMVGDHGVSGSDVKTQIGYINRWFEMGSLPDMCQAYPLFYYIIRALYAVFHRWTVVIMLFTLGCSFAVNIVQIRIMRLLLGAEEGLFPVLAGSSLSFIWPISFKYSFFGGTTFWEMPLEQVFLTSGATSPDHSLTYLLVKPFALICVYLFITILESGYPDDDRKASVRNLILFSAALLISVMSKPNFYQAFAPAGVVVVIVYLLKNGFKVFMRCVGFAVAYLPATAWVLYSMTKKLNPYAVSPFEGISIFNDGTPVSVILVRAVVFCIFAVICVIMYKKADNRDLLGWMVYLFGTGEFLLLIEPAEPITLSMSWGYFIGQYVLFALSIVSFRRLLDSVKGSTGKVLGITGYVLITWHTVMGVLVFVITWLPWWIPFLKTYFS